MDLDRVRYLILRCVACKEFITKIELVQRWEQMEKDENKTVGICECGGRQVRPGNLTEAERRKYESLWQWFRYKVLRKRDRGTRIWDLYYTVVKNGKFGPEYTAK